MKKIMDSRGFIVETFDNEFMCVICDCYMNSSQNAHQHSKGNRHIASLRKIGQHIFHDSGSRYVCLLCDCFISGFSNVYQHCEGSRHQNLFYDMWDSLIVIEQDGYCYLCDWQNAKCHLKNHAETAQHRKAVELYGRDISENDDDTYDCSLCDCTITSYKNVYSHLMGRRHQNELDD